LTLVSISKGKRIKTPKKKKIRAIIAKDR